MERKVTQRDGSNFSKYLKWVWTQIPTGRRWEHTNHLLSKKLVLTQALVRIPVPLLILTCLLFQTPLSPASERICFTLTAWLPMRETQLPHCSASVSASVKADGMDLKGESAVFRWKRPISQICVTCDDVSETSPSSYLFASRMHSLRRSFSQIQIPSTGHRRSSEMPINM